MPAAQRPTRIARPAMRSGSTQSHVAPGLCPPTHQSNVDVHVDLDRRPFTLRGRHGVDNAERAADQLDRTGDVGDERRDCSMGGRRKSEQLLDAVPKDFHVRALSMTTRWSAGRAGKRVDRASSWPEGGTRSHRRQRSTSSTVPQHWRNRQTLFTRTCAPLARNRGTGTKPIKNCQSSVPASDGRLPRPSEASSRESWASPRHRSVGL